MRKIFPRKGFQCPSHEGLPLINVRIAASRLPGIPWRSSAWRRGNRTGSTFQDPYHAPGNPGDFCSSGKTGSVDERC